MLPQGNQRTFRYCFGTLHQSARDNFYICLQRNYALASAVDIGLAQEPQLVPALFSYHICHGRNTSSAEDIGQEDSQRIGPRCYCGTLLKFWNIWHVILRLLFRGLTLNHKVVDCFISSCVGLRCINSNIVVEAGM